MAELNKFLSLAQTKLGCGYVLGAQGEIMTPALLEKLKYNYSASERAEKVSIIEDLWIGKQCFDCSGLIVWTLQQLGDLMSTQDYVADGIYHKLCTDVKAENLKIGDLCFYQNDTGYITHVAIYIGNNQVLHCRGTAYGVVITNLFTAFVKFGRLNSLDAPWADWQAILSNCGCASDQWIKAVNAAVNLANADGNLGDLEIFKWFQKLIEKVYNNKSDSSNETNWEVILSQSNCELDTWKRAINAAMSAAAANSDLGDLEILKYLPELIMKIYKSR